MMAKHSQSAEHRAMPLGWSGNLRRSSTHAKPRPGATAFTLIETLVVVSIIAILLTLLMPSLSNARSQMKTLKCTSNMRNIAFTFQLFNEGETAEGKGDSERLGSGRAYINDFQDSLYRVDEFWSNEGSDQVVMEARNEIMLCPAGTSQLTKKRGFPCGSEAIGPVDEVTVAMNMRLYRAVIQFGNFNLLAPVQATQLRRNISNHPYVPLAIDVDAKVALSKGADPYYIAPPLGEEGGPYATGMYWSPSDRHGGKTNVAFVGGQVLSSKNPQRESWNWAYQADTGN